MFLYLLILHICVCVIERFMFNQEHIYSKIYLLYVKRFFGFFDGILHNKEIRIFNGKDRNTYS